MKGANILLKKRLNIIVSLCIVAMFVAVLPTSSARAQEARSVAINKFK